MAVKYNVILRLCNLCSYRYK